MPRTAILLASFVILLALGHQLELFSETEELTHARKHG